jgi:hypothetical protein
MLKDAHGRYTNAHVKRVGRIAGPLGSELDRVFAENMGQTYLHTSAHDKTEHRVKVVEEFVQVFEKDDLVSCQPGRQHKCESYTNFEWKHTTILAPERMKRLLVQHCRKMDIRQEMLPDYGDQKSKSRTVNLLQRMPEDTDSDVSLSDYDSN